LDYKIPIKITVLTFLVKIDENDENAYLVFLAIGLISIWKFFFKCCFFWLLDLYQFRLISVWIRYVNIFQSTIDMIVILFLGGYAPCGALLAQIS